MQEALFAEIPDLGRQPDESLLVVADARSGYDAPIRQKEQLIEERSFGGITTGRYATVLAISVQNRPRTTDPSPGLREEMAG
jgi:hypothetical protein